MLLIIKKTLLQRPQVLQTLQPRNVKVSYSFLDNIAYNITRIISRHKSVSIPPIILTFKYQIIIICPLEGSCFSRVVVYRTNSTPFNGISRNWIGMIATDFKNIYSQYMHSFRHRNRESTTSLSRFLWRFRYHRVETASIVWTIVIRA